MIFDYYQHVSQSPVVCTEELFKQAISSQWLAEKVAAVRAEGDNEKRAKLKAGLPCVTWQAHCLWGRHNNKAAVPSGLYMVDIDHVEDVKALVSKILADKDKLRKAGVVCVHTTPSGHGVRIVAKFLKDVGFDFKYISQWQDWLVTELALRDAGGDIDEVCKDFARLSFLVPASDFHYLDEMEIWGDDEVAPTLIKNADLQEKPDGKPSARKEDEETKEAPKEEYDDGEKGFKYYGHGLTEIAEAWLDKYGRPQQGERHTTYYRLCSLFRYIADRNNRVLLAQLPTFGLSYMERLKECQHACAKPVSAMMPKDFYFFLSDGGFKPTKYNRGKMASLDDDDFEEEDLNLPTLPPVIRSFVRVAPRDYAIPQIYAMMPILGTLLSPLQARYIDGDMKSCTFHNVIYANQSSGKSFARKTVEQLTKYLKKHDAVTLAKEEQYKRELLAAKNKDKQPEKPRGVLRIISGITSQPKLLERQQNAGELHLLTFVEELDTIRKSNQGGSYSQKSDMYRQAWDNVEYSQDYMSDATFNGRVRLFLNFLFLGTPQQVTSFYRDPEDGLISRVGFCPINNQEFAKFQYWKEFNANERKELETFLQWAEGLTYTVNPQNSLEWTVNPKIDITESLSFMKKPIEDWLETKRLEALQAQDMARDTFRKRRGDLAWRWAMVCYGLYRGKIDRRKEEIIKNFALWMADVDLQNLCNLYGAKLSGILEQKEGRQGTNFTNVFKLVGEQFTKADLAEKLTNLGIQSPAKQIIYYWKKSGLIDRIMNEDKKLFYKKTKKGLLL